MRGASVFFNTYWIRFERGETTFDQAPSNSKMLFEAAIDAGVSKIVHVSVSNPSANSPLPYFSGKWRVEEALKSYGVPYAIIRPTLVFGKDDLLLNNIAWALRGASRSSPSTATAATKFSQSSPKTLRYKSSKQHLLPKA